MKVKMRNKTYEYDTTILLVEKKVHKKVKEAAKKEGLTIMKFMETIMDRYEGK